MLYWAVIFLLIAFAAAFFGFGGIAAASAGISANEDAYGREVSGKDILLHGAVSVNTATGPFHEALNGYIQ